MYHLQSYVIVVHDFMDILLERWRFLAGVVRLYTLPSNECRETLRQCAFVIKIDLTPATNSSTGRFWRLGHNSVGKDCEPLGNLSLCFCINLVGGIDP